MPAAVFQAVLIGPGYGSGREVMEFISQYGAVNGVLSLIITVVCFALVLFLTFELGRKFQVFDYCSFFKILLSRYWFVYELLLVATLLLVLAVSTSAAATLLETTYGIPYIAGAILILLGIAGTNYFGRRAVELTLTFGMISFTLVLLAYVVLVALNQGDDILSGLKQDKASSGWAFNGFRFAIYNSCVIPALLYVSREFNNRRETLVSSAVAACFGALPAIVFHLTFVAGLPHAAQEPLPTYWMIEGLNMPVFLKVFTIVLFIMIVQTGVGIIQGVNERLDVLLEKARGIKLSNAVHGFTAGIIFIISAGLSSFGIIPLIAKGYTAMAWGFIFVYFVPLVTRGFFLLWTSAEEAGSNRQAADGKGS